MPQLIDRRSGVQAQVRCDLLIPAAATMQFVARVADHCGELFFYEVVHVFGLAVFYECRRSGSLFADLLQPLQDADQFVGRKNARSFERLRVRTAGCQFITQQADVEVEGPLPALELRVQRLPEPSRPHLHRATSTRLRAREREGSPRMRMNPAASFWS